MACVLRQLTVSERPVLTRHLERRFEDALVVVHEEPDRAILFAQGGGERLEPVAVQVLSLVD